MINLRWCLTYMVAGVLMGAIAASSCGDPRDRRGQNRNRVPALSDYAARAQQSAQDAQKAADAAAKTQKDIQAQIDRLSGAQRNSSGELKEGRQELSSPGTVAEFTTKGNIGFVFAERT